MPAETGLSVTPELCERAHGIVKAAKRASMSIVTAESCTAGMIAAILSRAKGAGEVLHGGFVTYSKAHKASALGVSPEVLRDQGAVNAMVVTQLARGALSRSPASLSLAVSGVLGPDEDEDGNGVGLVYFCCLAVGGEPVVVKEEFGKKAPEQLLQAAIERAFDLIEALVAVRS